MGKLETFDIQLDNKPAVYYGGQLLTGRVIVSVWEPMKARAIRVLFNGRAFVYWTETKSRKLRRGRQSQSLVQTVHHNAEQVFFNEQVTLWGNPPDSAADPLCIPPGTTELRFQYQLPMSCPSSFQGTFGWIRYTCQANIDRPRRFDATTRRVFTIIKDFDLNMNASAAQAQQMLASKTLGCLCCVAGDVGAQVRIGKLGWVPGEHMNITGDVANDSSRRIKGITASLEQVTTFQAQGRSRTVVKPLHELRMGEVAPRDQQTWREQFLLIPSVPPTMTECEIIKIDYRLNFCATPAGLSFDLHVHLPILIGTIPLRSLFSHLLPASTLLVPPAPPMPLANQYPDLSPPTYAECVFGKAIINDDNDNENALGELEFAPLYTFYNFGQNDANEKR